MPKETGQYNHILFNSFTWCPCLRGHLNQCWFLKSHQGLQVHMESSYTAIT